MMKKPNDPKAGQQSQQPAKPGAVPPTSPQGRGREPAGAPPMPPRPGAAPAGKAVAGAKPAQAPAPRPAAAPMAKGPAPARPGPAPARAAAQPPAAPAAPAPGPNASPKEIIDHLAGQIQVLATRLEALRAQGAGNTTEFRQLEQMLNMVQDKLILAQSKIEKR